MATALTEIYPYLHALSRLDALPFCARAIWCLGDSFHDRNAATRFVPAVAERLARQAASARLLWIAGNHDGLSGGAWGGEVADELAVDGIVFRHQSLGGETRAELSGHFHPKLRLSVRGRPSSRPSFAGRSEGHTTELQSIMRHSSA